MLEPEETYNSIIEAAKLFSQTRIIHFQIDHSTHYFHVVVSKDTTLHVTFDKLKHQQAMVVKSMSLQGLHPVGIHISSQEFRDILTREKYSRPALLHHSSKKAAHF